MTIGPQKLGPYWLIGATTFSRIGTLAYTVVMTWAVSKAGGNNSVGWVNAAAGFTIVLVGISATFWLDKFDKRTLLLLLDAAAATVCLAAAVLLLVAMSSVVFTGVVVAVVTSAVASLYSPASRALIPSMVPAEGLERYNSVYTGFSETSRAAGPGLGALLLTVGGSEAFPLSLIINSISFIISFLLTLPLPADPPRQANEHKQKERTFFQSVRVITKHAILRGEVLGALSINFLLPSNTFILYKPHSRDRRKSVHIRACEFFRSSRGGYRRADCRNHRGTTAANPCKPTHGTNCPGLAFMPYRWDMGNHYLADDCYRTRDGLQHQPLQPATTRNPERKDWPRHCGCHHELCSLDTAREFSFLQTLHYHTHAHAHLGHKHHPPSGGVGDNDWQPKTRTIGLNEAQLLGKHAPAQR